MSRFRDDYRDYGPGTYDDPRDDPGATLVQILRAERAQDQRDKQRQLEEGDGDCEWCGRGCDEHQHMLDGDHLMHKACFEEFEEENT